jgi:PAS domain S-box-containing protein
MKSIDINSALLKKVDQTGCQLFNYLPDVYFFIKNTKGHFLKANQAFLDLFGYEKEQDIIGLTDFDMVSKELAIRYEFDDKNVMNSGIPIVDQKEPISSADATIHIKITTKVPLYDQAQQIIGIAGISRDMSKVQSVIEPLNKLHKAIEKIKTSYHTDLSISELADLSNMSVSTFVRRFKKYFKMPPIQYIKQVRIEAAREMIINTNIHFCQIAYECGYCDQSYMTREFKKYTGMLPRQYRSEYRENKDFT